MTNEKPFYDIRIFKDSYYKDGSDFRILRETQDPFMTEIAYAISNKDASIYCDEFNEILTPDDKSTIDNFIDIYNNIFIEDETDLLITHQELNKFLSVISIVNSELSEQMAFTIFKKDNVLMIENNSISAPLSESVSTISNKIKRSFRQFDSKFDKWYADYKKEQEAEERDKMMRTMPRPSKMLKTGLAIGGLSILNPILGLTAIVVKLGSSKKRSKTAQKRALRELNAELEIIEEEIRDAESEGDKNKKKKLMRARQKIKEGIERIKYGDAIVNI